MEKSRIPSLALTAVLVASSFVACTDGGSDGRAKSDTGIISDDMDPIDPIDDEPELEDLSCGVRGSNMDMYISNQEDIDAIKHCKILYQDVRIWGEIDSLRGLSVQEVWGDLWIRETPLKSLDGLDGLVKVEGDIEIIDNDDLASMLALRSLEIVQELTVYNNKSMVDVPSFQSLHMATVVAFYDNQSLTNIDGFGALTSIDHLYVFDNDALLHLGGFDALRVANISIWENPSLIDIPSFSSLTKSDWTIDITANNSLQEVVGFEALQNSDYIEIYNNPSLQSVVGFNEIVWVEVMDISNNRRLSTIGGFEKLEGADDFIAVDRNNVCESEFPESFQVLIAADDHWIWGRSC